LFGLILALFRWAVASVTLWAIARTRDGIPDTELDRLAALGLTGKKLYENIAPVNIQK
jgi:hypothetical protein